MHEVLGFFTLIQEPSRTSDELLRFDYCRRTIERRLQELGEDAIQRFGPVTKWMRLVIVEKAPELLGETYRVVPNTN
ncbi:MAG: hypothetical protein ACXAEL_03075 [Candidatus Hodarchaeales archaeon]|jgi:hypothetical protein